MGTGSEHDWFLWLGVLLRGHWTPAMDFFGLLEHLGFPRFPRSVPLGGFMPDGLVSNNAKCVTRTHGRMVRWLVEGEGTPAYRGEAFAVALDTYGYLEVSDAFRAMVAEWVLRESP